MALLHERWEFIPAGFAWELLSFPPAKPGEGEEEGMLEDRTQGEQTAGTAPATGSRLEEPPMNGHAGMPAPCACAGGQDLRCVVAFRHLFYT